MKKVIFTDIDGTIVDSFSGKMLFTEKVLYAFEELRKNHRNQHY